MELWDIYDKNRAKTGRTMERGAEYADGALHIVIHVCLFNAKDEMLIQQRQPFKEGWPNLWDVTCGGSALTGETSAQAAERELFEEVGRRYNFSGARPNFTMNFDHGFDDWYLVDDRENTDIRALELQYEEVQAVKWASLAEILRMIDSGEFIPYHKSLIELCFASRGLFGAINE